MKTFQEHTYLKKPYKFYVYVLQNPRDQVYIGFTSDLVKRVRQHQTNGGAVVTKQNGPWKLIHHETYRTQQEALARENCLQWEQRQ